MEIKTLEGRVALVPPAAGVLVRHGHEVFVQQGAGPASGYSDEEYRAAGARLVPSAAELAAKLTHHAYQGALDYQYEKGDILLRVHWSR